MESTTFVNREDFASCLKDTGPLSLTDHATFISLWDKLNVSNLAEMLVVYNICDVLSTLDGLAFYFESLFSISGLYPCHLPTISSYAIRSAMLHSRSPDNPQIRLFLPRNSEPVYNLFSSTLFGGFATVQCKYAKADYGFLPPPKVTDDHNLTPTKIPRVLRSSSTIDANSLYAGSTTICQLPYDDFEILEESNPTVLFREIEENLKKSNWDYFVNMAEQYQKSVLLVCDVDYDAHLGLHSSLDLSMFPRFRKCRANDLTKCQAAHAKSLGRRLDSEPPKLCSWNQRGEFVDYVDTFAFMVAVFSVKIQRLKKICTVDLV